MVVYVYTVLLEARRVGCDPKCPSMCLDGSPCVRDRRAGGRRELIKKERKKTDNPNEGWGRWRTHGQGPHLHEQDFGRTIRGTGGALLLLTRDTTGSQRGGTVETPNSTGGLISV